MIKNKIYQTSKAIFFFLLTRDLSTIHGPSNLQTVRYVYLRSVISTRHRQKRNRVTLSLNCEYYNWPAQKFLSVGASCSRYSSSAPITCAAPDGVDEGSKTSPSVSSDDPGSSLVYIQAKLCFTSGMETLKYQPSKNRRLVPSKW